MQRYNTVGVLALSTGQGRDVILLAESATNANTTGRTDTDNRASFQFQTNIQTSVATAKKAVPSPTSTKAWTNAWTPTTSIQSRQCQWQLSLPVWIHFIILVFFAP